MDVIEAPTPTAIPPWVARHRFSVEDYHRMGEAGIIRPEHRTELIEGEIIQMSPVGSPHLGAVFALNRLFAPLMAQGIVVSVQSPIRLDNTNEPEPDLALLRPRADGYRQPPPPSAADTLLLVEVSDTTLRKDRDIKLPLYARHAIPEVWIVDLDGRAIEIHRNPRDQAYQQISRHDPADTLRPSAFPAITVPVAEIL